MHVVDVVLCARHYQDLTCYWRSLRKNTCLQMAAFQSSDLPRYMSRDILISPRSVVHPKMSDMKRDLDSDHEVCVTLNI